MTAIFQVRFKTCDDEGDVYRSTELVYSTYDSAIVALRSYVNEFANVIQRHSQVQNMELIFVPEDNNYTGKILLDGIEFGHAWIQQLSMYPLEAQKNMSAALLDSHRNAPHCILLDN